jgi:hypothetical protein
MSEPAGEALEHVPTKVRAPGAYPGEARWEVPPRASAYVRYRRPLGL